MCVRANNAKEIGQYDHPRETRQGAELLGFVCKGACVLDLNKEGLFRGKEKGKEAIPLPHPPYFTVLKLSRIPAVIFPLPLNK